MSKISVVAYTPGDVELGEALEKKGKVVVNALLSLNVERQAWRFLTDDKKLTAFNDWFQGQIDDEVLSVDYKGDPWDAEYVDSAYRQGALRAYTDTHREELAPTPDFYRGTKEQFLRSSFGAPERVSKMKLLGTRTFEELRGVTGTMAQAMSRTLASGLANGYGPSKIAREMSNGITGLSRRRAEVIARTEIIHAHAEGQLDAFEDLGVEEVGIMAEWSTAGDEKVCEECQPLDGVVMPVEDARGLVPRHPNCRCCFTAALQDRVEEGQKRGPADLRQAITQSLRAETGARTKADAAKESDWAGKEL